jgi:hypothetical protein
VGEDAGALPEDKVVEPVVVPEGVDVEAGAPSITVPDIMRITNLRRALKEVIAGAEMAGVLSK